VAVTVHSPSLARAHAVHESGACLLASEENWRGCERLQVAHHFRRASDPEGIAAEFVLDPRVAALGGGTLMLANRFGRGEFDFRTTARIVIDQRNVAQAVAVLTQVAAAIGRIHEVVQVGSAFGGDQRLAMAARLSCIEALQSSTAIGTPQSAVSICSL